VELPAFGADRRAAGRPPLSIDISRPRGAQQQTRPRCCSGQQTGQTDRRTDNGPLQRPCSAYYASSVKRCCSTDTATWRITLTMLCASNACSFLPNKNIDRVQVCLHQWRNFTLKSGGDQWRRQDLVSGGGTTIEAPMGWSMGRGVRSPAD